MTKIARKHQKVFAINGGNNGQFGSAQLGTKILSSDVETLQSLAAYLDGWNSATISSNKIPTLEEFQALHYISNYQIAYLFQEGIVIWNTDTEYHQNSIVKEDGTYNLYGSITNTNQGNALSDDTKWLFLGNLKDIISRVSTKSADYTMLDDDNIGTLLIDDTSTDRTIDLPTLADNINRIITIKNISTDKGKVNVDGEGAETIDEFTDIDLDFKNAYITIKAAATGWVIIGENITSIKKLYQLTVSGTNWTTDKAIGVPYRDIEGTWRLKFNIEGSISIASNDLLLTITGLTFSDGFTNFQPVIGFTTTPTATTGSANANAATIYMRDAEGTTQTLFASSGDVELKSKPTFVE